jgi:hypothetical protein
MIASSYSRRGGGVNRNERTVAARFTRPSDRRRYVGGMTPDTPSPDTPLLDSLRARQLASRTAQVARALDAPARPVGGAFNADAAAKLTHWKQQ